MGAGPQQLTPDQLEALRQRVVNVVGHELRTPMTTLRGLIETLAEAEDPNGIRDEVVPALVRNARRLERLLDGVLVASGIDTPLPVDTPVPVSVESLVWEAWDTVGAHYELEVDTEGEAELTISRDTLRWALWHVLDNAVKYGEPPLKVHIRSTEEQVEIAVDSPGELVIPVEVDLVTEPFFRGYHAVTAAPGIGLGLTVARELLGHAGGKLEFSERAEGGALTRIMLPCRSETP